MSEISAISMMVDDLQNEVHDLTLLLKETNILLVASIGREKELMGAIGEHKEVTLKLSNQGYDPFEFEQKLWKQLGEVKR
jgi:uncharacterized Fe-S cluster-containing radical SAM superfamily protein